MALHDIIHLSLAPHETVRAELLALLDLCRSEPFAPRFSMETFL